MSYRVRFHPKAAKELQALDAPIQPRILAAVEALRADPLERGSVQLKGDKAKRIRVGDYRVIFEVDTGEAMVTVFRVAHRREAYR